MGLRHGVFWNPPMGLRLIRVEAIPPFDRPLPTRQPAGPANGVKIRSGPGLAGDKPNGMRKMDLYSKIQRAIAERVDRPKGILLGISSFKELEEKGHITRGVGGPFGIHWAENVPWLDRDIFAWCDPAFNGQFELPERAGDPSTAARPARQVV